MTSQKPVGQERVDCALTKAVILIEKINKEKNKPQTQKTKERIDSLKTRILKVKRKLVFLSTRARDKVTKFYASNALKEIAQKLRE